MKKKNNFSYKLKLNADKKIISTQKLLSVEKQDIQFFLYVFLVLSCQLHADILNLLYKNCVSQTLDKLCVYAMSLY